jgi:signal transduction histidine kinase
LPRTGPARAWLEHEGQVWEIQPGSAVRATTLGPWRLQARKRLASDSQPLDLVVALDLPARQWPWGWLAGWCLLSAGLALAGRAWQRQRDLALRSQALLRLGQVGRLNAMGELAAGMAHELNQPLTAVLASTQAAQRLLDDHLAAQRLLDEHLAAQRLLDDHRALQRPPDDHLPAQPLADEPPAAPAAPAHPAAEAAPVADLVTARQALAHSAQQARRAADVVARLRRLVQPVDPAPNTQDVALADAVRGVLYLLAPQLAQQGVQVDCSGLPDTLRVRADPVALEQILHNLVLNALQALEAGTTGPRRLVFSADAAAASAGPSAAPAAVRLRLRDNGPGFAPGALARAFEPFFTTRAAGLGLGLSLCESLAASQGGSLQAANAPGGGAELTLSLPGAGAAAVGAP